MADLLATSTDAAESNGAFTSSVIDLKRLSDFLRLLKKLGSSTNAPDV